jgi:hypothetical protein
MKVVLWLVVSIFGCIAGLAETYQTFEVDGKMGLRDANGNVVIPPAYDALGWSEGPFSVVGQVTGYKTSGRWGIIAVNNREITEATYTGLIPAEGNLILAYKRMPGSSRFLAGCLDTSGKEVIPFQYEGLTINSMRGIVYVRSGKSFKYGLIDLHNRPIIPIEYEQIQFLGSLRYAVQDTTGRFALFTEAGKPLTGFIFDDITRFRNNYAIVYQNGYQGIIDRNGLLRVNPSFTNIQLEDNGQARGRKQNKWTILDGKNNTLQTVQYDSIFPLGDDRFGIRKGAGIVVTSNNFRELTPTRFSAIGPFDNHRAVVTLNGRQGLIDNTGTYIVPPEYRAIRQDNDRIFAQLQDARWIMLDSVGVRLTSRTYDRIDRFNSRLFTVMNDRRYGIIDASGKEQVRCVYDSILQYADDRLVVRFHGDHGIIDLNENWLTAPTPGRQYIVTSDRLLTKRGSTTYLTTFKGEIIYFTANPVRVTGELLEETTSDGGTWKIGMDGRIVSRQAPPVDPFESIFEESEGLRGIKKDGRYGFVDNQGRLRIANRYEGIKPFREGLGAVKILGKWGFVNHAERIVVQPVYDDVGPFISGLAIVMQKGQYGLINKSGEVVLPMRYDQIARLPSGRFQLTTGDSKGLADKDGRLIFAPRYSEIHDIDNGYVIVGRAGRFGLVTLNGVSTIPMMYHRIFYDPYGERYFALTEAEWEAIP